MKERMKEFIREAYKTAPYYVWNYRDLDIDVILNEERWEEMPLLDRGTLIIGNASMVTPRIIPMMMSGKLIYARTSGSTGMYTEIFWTQNDYKKSMLQLWYYRKKYYDILPEDRLCYFYTIENVGDKQEFVLEKNKFGFSRMNLSMERLYKIYQRMAQFQPKWMLLQPSMAVLLCQCMDRYGLKPLKGLRYVEFSGEILTDEVRKITKEHFHCEIANQYGGNEFNSIAYECPCGRLHVMDTNVCVEVLDENGNMVYDKEGEIYVTTLTNTAMPLIRYQIGDRGSVAGGDSKCACGNHSPVFTLGSCRDSDWILCENNGEVQKISPNVFVRAFDCVNYLLEGVIWQFQVVQEDMGVFQIKLAVEEEEGYIQKEIEKIFMQSLEDERLRNAEYRFVYQEELFMEAEMGKLQWFKRIIHI